VISRFSRRRASSDDGFTLIELTVAMVITAMVMASLIIVFLGSIRGVALSKQRQAATGLATSTMEQFRALDYGTLSAGLYCSDLAGDANVTVSGTCGGGGTATLAPAGSSINETVKVQTSTPPAGGVAPIYPHVTTKTIENVTYTTKAYVTVSPTTPAAFNLTVLVTWKSSVTKLQTKTVTERSVEFSPSRCLSSATHPYSGACQAAFNADAGFANAVISISDASGASNISGFDTAKQLQLALGSLSTTLGVEQVGKLTGKVQTTSAAATSDSGTSSTGGTIGTVAADSDPSSATLGTPQTASISQGSVNTVSLSGPAGTFNATPANGGTGTLDAEVTSTGSSCQDAGGNPINALNRPCTWGTRQSSGTGGTIKLQLPNGAPNFSVVSVGTEPAKARATVAIIPGAGGTACPTASGAGCVTAQASRSLGAIALGGLPSGSGGDVMPSNWGGSLINLSGVVESAYSDSGVGARATPRFTRSAGTLTYYDASTSTVKSLDLTALASDQSVTVAPVTATYNLGNGHQTVITESATFTAGASSFTSSSAPDATCKTQPCTASASPSSTLVAKIFYTVVQDGVQTTSFAVNVDLGACVAKTSYTAAFDA
jgi:prepilin-type N-terminal cleavage/methylation domain-containing protein